MASPSEQPDLPRVCAVLVVHDGAQWLPSVLSTLARLRYPKLDLVAVDNASTDGSGRILAERLHPSRILTLPENVGFGRAVSAAVGSFEAADRADLLLLLHDDLLLHPNALIAMVAALQQDETVGIVGPKLREWGDERVLQEVGLTIDRLGRSESRLEAGEIDQGQHDTQRPVLYVSTAGMLLRRDVLRRVGAFDVRFPAFRDDLDFCWRAWLAGERVEVVPAAVGFHLAAASRQGRRLGQGSEARYLAERHTLATLLKNYGLSRLLWVAPVVGLVGVIKVIAFLGTRRFGDAMATVRAYAWNVGQLPRTLRRRRQVQRRRQRSDTEIIGLFARGLPRLRTYGEAFASWLAGGSTRALMDEGDGRGLGPEERSLLRTVRDHPAAVVGSLLLILYLAGAANLLGAGPIVGGEIAPWPEQAREFFRAYVSPANGDPLASDSFASPGQALLGLVSLLGFGSPWLAQRLVVLGLLPLAWLLALRAGRLVTVRPGPRVLGATLYAISPVLLGAISAGRLGVMVVATLLPGLLLVGLSAADPRNDSRTAWRSTALLSLGLVVAAAMAPALLPLLGVLYIGLVVLALLRVGRRAGRLVLAGLLALAVLSPWLYELATGGWAEVVPPAARVDLPLWRALGLAPQLLSDGMFTSGWLVTATSAAVVAAALLLGLRARPLAVAALLAVWTAAAIAAWAAAAYPVIGLWAPALLLPGVLAKAGLGILAARWLADSLGAYAFGLRQLATVVVSAVLLVGLLGGVARIATGPFDGLRRDPELLPAFVSADTQRVGPYRVVQLRQSEGIVRWDVTEAEGPAMVSFGTIPDRELTALLDEALGAVVGGVDPSGGVDLGLANVRYLVIPEGGAMPDLVAAINRQPGLEPLPAGEVHVWRTRSWLPRAVVLPPGPAEALEAIDDPGDISGLEEQGLQRVARGRYSGPVGQPDGGLLVVSEGADGRWHASADGRALEGVPLHGLEAFRVEPGAEQVTVSVEGGWVRLAVVVAQLVLALGILSLALRPPGSRQRRAAAAGAELPSSLVEADETPPGGIVGTAPSPAPVPGDQP